MMMGIFSRCQVALELDSCVNLKKKAALKKKIIDNDGIVSFIVTKKVVVFLHREYDINMLTCVFCYFRVCITNR